MTTAIWLRCVKCGKQTDTDHAREGVCRMCIVEKALLPDRERYMRLVVKRKRYEQHGHLRQFNDQQRIDAEKKIVVKFRSYAPWVTSAEISKYLIDCRMEAEGRVVQLTKGLDGLALSRDGKSSPPTKTILVARPSDVADHFRSRVAVPSIIGSGEETVGANTGVGVHRKFKLEKK